MTKVALIEDDLFIKNELVSLINKSEQLECLMSASSAENFFKYFKISMDFKILLLDIGLPGMSGIQVIPKIKHLRPDIEIIVLSSFYDNDNIFKALRTGASGYLLKDESIEKIEQILVGVTKGIFPLSPAIASRIINFFNKSTVSNKKLTFNLTPREVEVVRLLVDGLSYKLIAGELHISLNGVQYHIKNIYKKLHINARPQMMKMYMNGNLDCIFKRFSFA